MMMMIIIMMITTTIMITRCTHWQVPCQKAPSLYLF
jgi:hypothetical protein